MELTDHVKPAPKVESVRTYSADEEATVSADGPAADGAGPSERCWEWREAASPANPEGGAA